MKNKGFTLIELVASLIVLSIIALIVTSNVINYIKKSKGDLYALQIDSIESSAKNWMGDYLTNNSKITTTNLQTLKDGADEYIYLFLPTLQTDAYIDSDLYNNKTGEDFTEYVFVVVKCSEIPADENNSSSYKYTYQVIDTTDKLLEFLAKKTMAKFDNTTVYPKVLTINDLFPIIPNGLKLDGVLNKFIDIESGSLISSVTITITSATEYTISI